MVRPPDDLCSERTVVVLGHGTTLDTGADYPLMSDATQWNRLLFLSGRAAVYPATGALRAENFAHQLRIVLEDCFAVLAAAGSGPENVLRVECWLVDRGDFPELNAQFIAAFEPPRPARSTFIVAGLPIDGLLVELQLTAGVPA